MIRRKKKSKSEYTKIGLLKLIFQTIYTKVNQGEF